MTTPPVMSLIDEIVAELELACEEAALVSLGRTTIRRLLSERAELKLDAERYRWLRDGESSEFLSFYALGFPHDQLDAAIDAAMTP